MRHGFLILTTAVLSCGAAVAATGRAWGHTPNQQTAAAPAPPQGQEVQFSPDQRNEYYAVYKRPEVKYLRTVLNAYLAGKRRSDMAYDALHAFDRNYYRSKFIVITIVTPSGGGSLMTIMFQGRPDALFKAWVSMDVHAPKTRLELRQFEKTDVGPESVEALRKKYRQLLQDKAHAM